MSRWTPKTAFAALYGDTIANDSSLECMRCGTCVCGDNPTEFVVCTECLEELYPRLQIGNETFSFDDAVESELVGHPINWENAEPTIL